MTRATLVVLAAAVLVAGCSGARPGATGPTTTPHKTHPSTSVAPPPAPPVVDACRNLTYGDISHYSNADPVVDCTKPHTSYTFAVESLPATVSVTGASIGNKSIQHAASAGCNEAFASFIGGTEVDRELSRLTVTYFLPDQAGFDLGASWVRCDVVALQTPRSLGLLPDKLKGFLDGAHALDDYGLCSQNAPGSDTATLVMCKERHMYRALTAIRLGADGAAYPGTEVTSTGGQQKCADFVTAQLGAAGGYTYAWTFPTATDWSNGQRYGYCWLKQGD